MKTFTCILWATASLILTACSSIIGSSATHTGYKTIEVETSAATAVDVLSQNGSVIVQTDSTVEHAIVEVDVHAGGATDAEAKTRFDNVNVSAKALGGVLQVRVSFPKPFFGNDGASITVTLPAVEGVSAATTNGDIEVVGANGTIVLKTSNGGVTVLDSKGITVIETSNGVVSVRDYAGPLEVTTSNGEIAVVLSDDADEAVYLTTSNGDVQLSVASAFKGSITGSTSNGQVEITDTSGRAIKSEMGKNAGSIDLGEGPRSKLKTSNGSIAVIVN